MAVYTNDGVYVCNVKPTRGYTLALVHVCALYDLDFDEVYGIDKHGNTHVLDSDEDYVNF